MGSVRKRPSDTWEARWYGPDGRQHSANFMHKGDATSHVRLMEGDKERGTHIDPRLRKTPLRDVAEEWLATLQVRPKTAASYRSILHYHLLNVHDVNGQVRPGRKQGQPKHPLSSFGNTPIGRVNPALVRELLAALAKQGVGPGTQRNIVRVLTPIMRYAVDKGLIPVNPLDHFKLPKANGASSPKQEQAFLTAEQVAELAEAVGPEYRDLILVAAYSGMRAGELVALRRGDVDTLHRQITVRASVSDVNGNLVEVPPKNGKIRTAMIPRDVCNLLDERLVNLAESDLVFRARDGGYFRHSNFYSRHFKKAVDRLVTSGHWPSKLKDLRFHDLRHTCASLLIAQAVNPKAIQEQLGHSSITITLDTYGHLYGAEREKVADALEAVFQAAAPAAVAAVAPIRP